jgi:predicted transcriptional regulator
VASGACSASARNDAFGGEPAEKDLESIRTATKNQGTAMKTTKGATRTVKRPKRAPSAEADTRTVKEILQNVVNKLPPDCTWDDVMYQVYVCQKIAAGLRDAQEGRLLTEEEVFRDLNQ